MYILRLVISSLRNRALTTTLTLISISLSVMLLVGIEQIRTAARSSFEGTISKTSLIVGARSGPVQLLLYTIFHIGQPTANVSFRSYQRYANHPDVEWTIPISLGDSHRGFRVVATDENFYEHYRYRSDRKIEFESGSEPEDVFDVVLGSEVANKLGYDLGEEVVIAHGMSSFVRHENKPFVVTGILDRTSTPIDRSLYISLDGMEAIHVDWGQMRELTPGEVRERDLTPSQISAFLVRVRAAPLALRLQREINTDDREALMAILPGVTLAEMWRSIGYAEGALRIVSFLVILVGFSGMLMSIYSTLNERRREMAILRGVGARPAHILFLMVFESTLLSAAGAALGMLALYAVLFLAQPVIEDATGIYLPLHAPTAIQWVYIGGVVFAGFLLGFIPALRAYRNTLTDGLTIRL